MSFATRCQTCGKKLTFGGYNPETKKYEAATTNQMMSGRYGDYCSLKCYILDERTLRYMPGFDLDWLFTYHPPKSEQLDAYNEVRRAAKTFAEAIIKCTPACADQSAAIRHVREAAMTANAAIALEGKQ